MYGVKEIWFSRTNKISHGVENAFNKERWEVGFKILVSDMGGKDR